MKIKLNVVMIIGLIIACIAILTGIVINENDALLAGTISYWIFMIGYFVCGEKYLILKLDLF